MGIREAGRLWYVRWNSKRTKVSSSSRTAVASFDRLSLVGREGKHNSTQFAKSLKTFRLTSRDAPLLDNVVFHHCLRL
jgi:hypothetical protein